MTTPTLPDATQQDAEGRSVRDVVEYRPEQVNDAWCRKILHKMLQSLELQYAMQMPHRGITPDTIVFHANGEPFLLSDDIDAAPAPDAYQADDLAALAGVLHYAITQELVPTAPLHGRVDGYGADLIATIDACMDPDPTRRPPGIAAVRGLLGMATGPVPVALALATTVGVAGATASAAARAAETRPAAGASIENVEKTDTLRKGAADLRAAVQAEVTSEGPAAIVRHRRRWPIVAAGAGTALAIALIGYTQLRQVDAIDPVVVAAPSAAAVVTPRVASSAVDVPGAVTADPASQRAQSAASGASSSGTTAIGGAVDAPSDQATVASGRTRAAPVPAPVPSAPAPVSASETANQEAKQEVKQEARNAAKELVKRAANRDTRAAPGKASYQLQIAPWGNVVVDGVNRGISPPLKRLTLTPGRHTVQITHPNYRDTVLEFDTAQTTSNGKIIVDFNREAD